MAKGSPKPSANAQCVVNIVPLKPNDACLRCALGKSSKTVCCEGKGPENSPYLFVGEALGAQEEIYGRPFVSDAGFKLNYLLHRADLPRKSIRVENAVRCRPPKNRTPKKQETQACFPYLLHAIFKQKPIVIVAMGATAVNSLFENSTPILPKNTLKVETVRGFYEKRTFSYFSKKRNSEVEHTCYVIPTFHPSACLRNWEHDDLVAHDFNLAKKLVGWVQGGKYVASKLTARVKNSSAEEEALKLDTHVKNSFTWEEEPQRWPDTQVKVLRQFSEAMNFLHGLKKLEGFVIDIESTALSPHTAEIMCLGFRHCHGHATILPLLLQDKKAAWTPRERGQLLDTLADVLTDAEVWGQNVKFDINQLRKLTGVWPIKAGFDTMLAHHVLDENKPHNLTFLCQWFLNWKRYDAAMDAYKINRVFRIWDVPDEQLWRYCGYDVDGTFRLRGRFKQMLIDEDVENVFHIELGLVLPLADMEFRGIHLDKERILELSDFYRREVERAKKTVMRVAINALGEEKGAAFNYASSQQLSALMVKLGAPLRKKTPAGALSVGGV